MNLGNVGRGVARALPDRQDLRNDWRDYVAAALSGAIMRLAFPTTDLWWTAWFGLVPLFWSLRHSSGKAAFYRGWVFGAVFFYGICFFLNTLYVYVPIVVLGIVLLAIVSGLYAAVFAWGAAKMMVRMPALAVVAVPAWWTILEAVRSSGELAFPFGSLSHSQWSRLGLIQIVSITGSGAISFLIVMVNFALWRTFADSNRSALLRARRAALAAAVVCVVWAVGHGYRVSEKRIPDPTAVDVLMIQPNVPQKLKWDSYMGGEENALRIWDEMLAKTVRITDEAVAEGRPDLILWCETAVPDRFFNVRPRYRRIIEAGVKRWSSPLLMGANRVILREERHIEREYNSAYLFSPREPGRPIHYDKMHLVLFGEDFSYLRYVPFLEVFGLGVGTFNRGEEVVVFPLPAEPQGELSGVSFATTICFESTIPHLFRQAARKGAGFHVVITNDGWYGTSSGPAQHMIQSVFRAIETRRWLCRCANTGISCFISPEGEISEMTALSEEAAIRRDVSSGSGLTFYARWGPWFPLLCLVLGGASLLWSAVDERRDAGAAFEGEAK